MGLLALLVLTDSRRAARTAASGALVLLADQDRRLWDRSLIDEGQAIVRKCLRRNLPGPYQIQAAINAVHSDAVSVESTQWEQIVALYDQLMLIAPTPVVALNRAVAIGELDGAAAALALVDELHLDSYLPFHVARAEMLRRLGRPADAATAYRAAITLASNRAERHFLESRLAVLE
jgi:RNA polymerase sigma-70 factor (ECF subfamily)